MIAVGPEPHPFQDETMPPATFIEPTASSQQTNTGRGPDAVDGSMIDPFGRHITYLRVSVTDCFNFRCVYCMAEDMTFLPKAELRRARTALLRIHPARWALSH